MLSFFHTILASPLACRMLQGILTAFVAGIASKAAGDLYVVVKRNALPRRESKTRFVTAIES